MHYHPARLLISLSLASENKIVAYYEHVNNPTYGLDTIERRIISVIYVPIITPITFLPSERAIFRAFAAHLPPSPPARPSLDLSLSICLSRFEGTLCLFHLSLRRRRANCANLTELSVLSA